MKQWVSNLTGRREEAHILFIASVDKKRLQWPPRLTLEINRLLEKNTHFVKVK